jgi:histone deacetylase 1/2
VKASNTEDLNTPGYLERVTKIVMQNLRHIGGPPGIQATGASLMMPNFYFLKITIMSCEAIPNHPLDEILDDLNADEDIYSPDDRRPMRILDSRMQAEGELSDSDDEGEGGRRNHDIEGAGGGGGGGRKFGIGIMNAAQRSTSTTFTASAGVIGGSVQGLSPTDPIDVDFEEMAVTENGVNGTGGSQAGQDLMAEDV